MLIDTGQTPKDSHIVMAALKKLTSQPIRFIIHTEPHQDHTIGDFVFSPPGDRHCACRRDGFDEER